MKLKEDVPNWGAENKSQSFERKKTLKKKKGKGRGRGGKKPNERKN